MDLSLTFPTECVMSSSHIHLLPILFQSSFVPSDILVSAFMVYVFLCMGMWIYICVQHKPQITEDMVVFLTWISYFCRLKLKVQCKAFSFRCSAGRHGQFHNNQPFEFSSLSPCAGFLFCFRKCLFLASLGPGWSWTCCGPDSPSFTSWVLWCRHTPHIQFMW